MPTTDEALASFRLLHPVVQHHIVNSLGWTGLRQLQADAVKPLLRGDDCLLIAPTAGGKTEAATFPLLTRIQHEHWVGLSVLYVCPLKALLNNLEPRLSSYASWLGLEAAVRHGDTTTGQRRRQLAERPSIMMTTPESLEAMLVSPSIDNSRLFGDLRAVVVDEVHAFAGDDRGWHLLAVLERLESIAGQRLQRIGLSATVGNPDALLQWLQGTGLGRQRAVVAPKVEAGEKPQLSVDFVGNVTNAAAVINRLHRGEKRLVFADSRRNVEALASRLRDHEVDTFVSHSSLSASERRRAETAFAEARDCVIVSTSTLELGIDVGDLDRVLQLGAPNTVASILQRLGRTGRRPGSSRNMTFLETTDEEFLRSIALLLLMEEGFVEPVVAPPEPRHIAAQQLLGTALQKGQTVIQNECEWMGRLGLASPTDLDSISKWLISTGHLDTDQGMGFVGPATELRYGRRNFMDLLAVFTAPPEVTVLHGTQEIGSVDPTFLTTRTEGPRILALAGRSWAVKHIDWKRRRVHVEPSERRGKSQWVGEPQAYSPELAGTIRRVLLGAKPTDVQFSQRALSKLSEIRDELTHRVAVERTVITLGPEGGYWWTFAGARGNAVLQSALAIVAPGIVTDGVATNLAIPLAASSPASDVEMAIKECLHRFGGSQLDEVDMPISEDALARLKFAELLPRSIAVRTLAARSADPRAAYAAAQLPRRIEHIYSN